MAQRDATRRATANAVYATDTEKQQPRKEAKKTKEPKAPKQQVLAAVESLAFVSTTGTMGVRGVTHYSHNKELRKGSCGRKEAQNGGSEREMEKVCIRRKIAVQGC